jgi:hypothetical protein
MTISNLLEEAAKGRWDEARARKWYDGVAWPVGCNFLPSGAINQLEMWQADTFNPEEIDRELGWLAAIGMNTARVFLHDLLWQQDAKGFLSRLDQFLNIADKHGMRILFVFFDSCWNPYPVLGPQRAPTPGVHNSYWAQSPGYAITADPAAFSKLEDYVTGVIGHFRNDPRVLVWDLWNEPGNYNIGSFMIPGMTLEKQHAIVTPLLAQTFQWARSANPSQPLTSGVWDGDYSNDGTITPLLDLQLRASDVISFHSYNDLAGVRSRAESLERFHRPIICTEYMARGAGCTFEAILPYFKEKKIGAYNWGAVAGKSQTNYPWDSWAKPYPTEPALWHHDIFRRDGTPYEPKETALIKSLVRGQRL